MKPAVDRLEKRLGQKLTFVRSDVQTEIGKLLYAEYEANLVPTFIVFDHYGDKKAVSYTHLTMPTKSIL